MEASNSISDCGVIWIDVIECGVDASLLYKGVKDKHFLLHSQHFETHNHLYWNP